MSRVILVSMCGSRVECHIRIVKSRVVACRYVVRCAGPAEFNRGARRSGVGPVSFIQHSFYSLACDIGFWPP